jgi:hypothetical protein
VVAQRGRVDLAVVIERCQQGGEDGGRVEHDGRIALRSSP